MSVFNCYRNRIKLSGRTVGDDATARSALLIHGLNTNMAFWHQWLVRSLSSSHRLIMSDLRGHGYSDLAPSGYTCGELSDDAVAILDHCETAVVDVIAHSFGAGIALQLARRYPDRVRSLTILDGRLRCVQPDLRLGDWTCFPRWAEHFAKAGIQLDPSWEFDCTLPMRLDGTDLTQVDSRLAADGFFVSVYSKRAMAKYRQLLMDTTALVDFRNPSDLTREQLRDVKCPVGLVYGTISPFLATGECLAEELSAPLELLEDCGHNFAFNYPERTFEAMIKAGWPNVSLTTKESAR